MTERRALRDKHPEDSEGADLASASARLAQLAGPSTREIPITHEAAATIEGVVFDALRPVSVGLMILWLVFIPFNLIDLPAHAVWPVVMHDVFMVMVSVTVYWGVRARVVEPRYVGPIGFAVALLIASNILLTYWLTGRPFYTDYLALVQIGVASFVLLTRWAIAAMVVILAAWFPVASHHAAPGELVHLGFVFGAGTMVGLMLHFARLRTHVRLAQLRIRDGARKQALEQALSAAEEVKLQLDRRVEERTAQLRGAYENLSLELVERERLEEEQSRLQADLHRAQRLESIGRLAGGIAHDFNNLLTVISGSIELVLDEELDDWTREGLEEAMAAADRAAGVTSQLLAYGRKQPMEMQTVSLVPVVTGVESILRRMAAEKVRIELDLDGQAGPVKVDPAKIEQVLINLTLNACDAMSTGGVLRIRVHETTVNEALAESHENAAAGTSYVVLTVSDSGSGMSAEVQRHLFEPFFTTKGTGEGTGLGLAVVHGIVSQSSGFIQVESREGEGTAFHVHFPRVAAQPARRMETPLPVPIPVDGERTILLAEDELSVRRFATIVLERLNHRVLAAESGEQALELARAHVGPIHLLITDVVMPGIDGPEVASRLEEMRPRTPVLFVSGYSEQMEMLGSRLGKGQYFLPKPYSAAVLRERVQSIVGRGGPEEAPPPKRGP